MGELGRGEGKKGREVDKKLCKVREIKKDERGKKWRKEKREEKWRNRGLIKVK